MKIVVTAIPHFWKAMGSVRTPPPRIVAMRLKVPTSRLDGLSLLVVVAAELCSSSWCEEKGGTR